MNIDKNVFDPAKLSFADCDFLLAHAGEAPIVALRDLPPAANRVTVTQWLERFYELNELQKASNGTADWVGAEAVKKAISNYLEQRRKWTEDHNRYGAPKFPSMYAFDARGNAHYSGPGSDSGSVKTYFDATGKRIAFAVNLFGDRTAAWKPEWVKTQPATVMQLKEVAEENCWKCGVPGCGHTEVYKPDSRASRSVARARMSKHLRKAQSDIELHLELHTLEFGSVDK